MKKIEELRKESKAASRKLSKFGWADKLLVIDDGRYLVAEKVLNDIIHNAEGEIILDNVMDEHHFIVDVISIDGVNIDGSSTMIIDNETTVLLRTKTFLTDEKTNEIEQRFQSKFDCKVILLDARFDIFGTIKIGLEQQKQEPVLLSAGCSFFFMKHEEKHGIKLTNIYNEKDERVFKIYGYVSRQEAIEQMLDGVEE